MNEKQIVLILDGETRAALAAVRSLGQAGYTVEVASFERTALAFASKYVAKTAHVQVSRSSPSEYRDWISRYLSLNGPRVVLPVSDYSTTVCSELSSNPPTGTVISVPPAELLSQAQNKQILLNLAAEVGVNVPETHAITLGAVTLAELEEFANRLKYPVAVKQNVSAFLESGSIAKATTRYADSASEFLELIPTQFESNVPLLVQQKIVGQGVGVFALCHQGESALLFAHRRILEKPPSGGVSVLSEAIPLSNAPVQEAKRLLKHLNWRGLAMVEFKRETSTGRYFLMEINPRLWGSLQLAVDSGRDFSRHLIDYVTAANVDEVFAAFAQVPEVSTGRRLRWYLGTLDHAIIRARREGLWFTLSDILLKNALQIGASGTHGEILRSDDPRPALRELLNWLGIP